MNNFDKKFLALIIISCCVVFATYAGISNSMGSISEEIKVTKVENNSVKTIKKLKNFELELSTLKATLNKKLINLPRLESKEERKNREKNKNVKNSLFDMMKSGKIKMRINGPQNPAAMKALEEQFKKMNMKDLLKSGNVKIRQK